MPKTALIDRLVERLLEADAAPAPGAGADPRSPDDIFMDTALSGNYGADDLGNKHLLDKKRWSFDPLNSQDSSAQRQKLEKNTYLRRWKHEENAPYTYAVLLHDTHVLTCEPDGRVFVNSGGWKTEVTMRRIGAYLGKCLPNATKVLPLPIRRRGQWYWWFPEYNGGDGRKAYFNDGDWFEPDGTLHHQGDLMESATAGFDVESAACNYIEQEVGRYDWKANWEHHRQQPGVEERVQAWLDHFEYGGQAAEVIEFINGTMMQAEGRWR